MADTILRRMGMPDQWLDDCLESAADHARRAAVRARAREIWTGKVSANPLAKSLRLPFATVQRALREETFGRAWSRLERVSPVLRRRIVSIGQLQHETVAARAIVEEIRATGCFSESVHRGDIESFASVRGHEVVALPAE
jgi:hypothetical protein